MHKLPSSFFGAAPTSNASVSTASTVSSGSPARKKSKPTASATTEDFDDYLLGTVCDASTASADLAPSLPLESFSSEAAVAAKPTAATNVKNDEAKDVASVSSGNTKNEEVEVEDFLYLFMEVYDKDEERKMPPPDSLWLEANMKQLELLKTMKNICDKNTATLDKTCPLPSLIRKVAEWFNKLSASEKKLLRTLNPPHPYVIFDHENARELYPGKSDKELEALSKEDLYKVKILAFCPTKEQGAGSLHSLVKGGKLSSLTGTHVIRNGLFLIDKWDPLKKGTKQLHEINIENKMESMKRIADFANLSLDMNKLKKDENIISRAKHSATNVSNNDRSWNANFAMLVEYVGEHFRIPCQRDGPTAVNDETKLGKWYSRERNKSFTTARGDRMLVMKDITSILYSGRHLRNNLGPCVKNNVKKMISELKSLSPS
jgi:hypothetical protein